MDHSTCINTCVNPMPHMKNYIGKPTCINTNINLLFYLKLDLNLQRYLLYVVSLAPIKIEGLAHYSYLGHKAHLIVMMQQQIIFN